MNAEISHCLSVRMNAEISDTIRARLLEFGMQICSANMNADMSVTIKDKPVARTIFLIEKNVS